MTTSLPDYYALLEVSASATLQQIKRSYRRLARLYHPDINVQGREGRDERIKQLNEAYAILSDVTRRAAYDALLRKQRQAEQIADAIRDQQAEAQREPKMTWTEGVVGFVRELRKGIHED